MQMQMQLYALEGAVICLVYMFINLIHINYADFKHETDAKFKDIEFLVDIELIPNIC
jgi:hypothetical protein